MTDRGVYNMQLQRAAYSLTRAQDKADEGQRQRIQKALDIVQALQTESKEGAATTLKADASDLL